MIWTEFGFHSVVILVEIFKKFKRIAYHPMASPLMTIENSILLSKAGRNFLQNGSSLKRNLQASDPPLPRFKT